MDVSPRLTGDDWQIWADKLLKRYYGPGEYQPVPDKQKGDAGIEGFAISCGHAYQAYGPEDEPLSVSERYERHRNKITNDIKKFIDNRVILCNLFGRVKISRWILLVPICDSKEIIRHAAKKTEEVLAANLPYVRDDFRILVEDETTFLIERDELLNAKVSAIAFETENINDITVNDWIDHNDKMVVTIDDKLNRLPTIKTEKERYKFRNDIIKAYLNGQNTLVELRGYPTAYENICKTKSDKERYLSLEIRVISNSDEILSKCYESIRDLAKKAPGISDTMAVTLAWEAIADWLIRCPLDFPQK